MIGITMFFNSGHREHRRNIRLVLQRLRAVQRHAERHQNHRHRGIADHVDRVVDAARHHEIADLRGDRGHGDAQQRADEQRLMQRLLQDLLRGDLAFGGHVEHGQADRREHRLLHDQDRRDQSAGLPRMYVAIGRPMLLEFKIQRIQRADGGVRGLHMEEQPD